MNNILKLYTQKKCPKCPVAKEVAVELQTKNPKLKLEICDMDADENCKFDLLMRQITTTPVFILNGEVVYVGEVPTVQQLERRLK